MICPNCGFDNLPGSEECTSCGQDLTQLDRPVARDRVERSLMEDTVGGLCSIRPIVIRPQATLQEALRVFMGPPGVGALLIVNDQGKLIGILSERDLLTKVVGRHADFAQLPVEQFMTPDPESVAVTDSLAFALHKMDIGGYRHLQIGRAHV